MPTELLHTVLSNVWVVFLVVVLFCGSIFVHELGHFLAARLRGAHVERFSIGFGPPIWSWRGRDGVEYRISWIPLGGYVLLPQLADLGALEGASAVEVQRTGASERAIFRKRQPNGDVEAVELPPVNYPTKMIVFVAGALFNVLFAFLLACVVWIIGQPVATGLTSTTVAEVLPKIRLADGRDVESPAAKAGLKSGDVILAVDGRAVETFGDIQEQIALSSGWKNGERETVLTVRRGAERLDLPVRPVLAGPEKLRTVGFTPMGKLVVGRITPGSAAAKAGLEPDDQITAVDGKPALNRDLLARGLRDALGRTAALTVTRGLETKVLSLAVPKEAAEGGELGLALKTGYVFTHPNPFAQVTDAAVKTFRSIVALVNPHSDIGISQASGPIGMISTFVDASRAGLPFALWFTIIVNVNLAIFNLLPIPVLDGGQMLFATIARLRGRALPINFVMATQSVFIVLLFALIGYISLFVDIPRIARDHAAESSSAPARSAAPATPPAAPAPAK